MTVSARRTIRRNAFLALILAGICWGLGFPLGKLALRETTPAHMVLLRFAVAAVAALPFVLGREARALFASPAVLLAGSLYALGFLVQFEGLARVSVTLAALLVGAMPALIAVSARLLGERTTAKSWAGVAAATLGAVLIAGDPGGAGSLAGVLLSLASLLLFLGWFYALKGAPTVRAPLAMPAVTVIVAALAILPISLAMHGAPRLDLSVGAWAGIVGQGLLSTMLATAAWQYGSSRVGSASAGVFINIEPLMGAIIGVALFGDRLTAALAAGGVLIILGSLAVVLGEDHHHDAPPTVA
ncbi:MULTISPECIES: DMT family transporter [unclassified Sphingomonas]|jgi:drug/metabolite transporter (DMT)-like permease|uniref:DMT family transporter n=1 Tax=unclassified Sphingomonas TaxID=196159 RepID=UPI000E10059B|nr:MULTISPECIES: DMT family transporter [unclassified Sphingomonas]AXJ95505.1 EamA/RhaT family transporter [Sphingomonas sp. FARSPH]